MNFAEFCNFLDDIRFKTGFSEKAKVLKSFLKSTRDNQAPFSIMRLLLPKLDRDRPSYRIKESKISKLLIKMLGLPPGTDRNRLTKAVSGSSIDFGDVVYSILKKFIVNKDSGLTTDNINTYLDEIANRTTDTGLDDLVLKIFRQLSPKNIKWLIQILLKDLKLGISDNSVLNCYHEDGANFYATNNNLRKVCEVLSNPQVKLNELEITIFEPFRSMLSKRCDAANFKKCIPDAKSFVIENKFDGERFQIHMDQGQYKYFSRNGFDFTASYEASLTPLLKTVIGPETRRVILDGEMMLWNKHTNSFGSKGMNLDVKKLSPGKYQPCFCAFDILLHNDKILTNQPLYKRLHLLRNVIKTELIGSFVVSVHAEGKSRQDIVDALNRSVDNNDEGIVVKDPKSVYKCGDRNSGWFKLKMDYMDDAVHDLDVLMMGGCYAGAKINSFFVGVSSGPNTYYSFGRIGSGLNEEQLDVLNDKLKRHGSDFKSFASKSLGHLFFGRDVPDVYIEPQHSCVLQIRASELTRTTNDSVKCPYTLRFPRVLAIRQDKPVDECLSMNELLDLTRDNKAVIKLNKRHIELDEVLSKTKPAKKIKIDVINLANDNGDFLEGKRFYVSSGTLNWPIEEIYHCIKKAGGEVCYRLEPNVDVVLVSKLNPNLSNLLKQANNFDVIHVDWLRRVLDKRRLVLYQQTEIYSLGTSYRRDFCTGLDQFGDSYEADASKESLTLLFKSMKRRDDYLNTNNALVLDNERKSFAKYVAYFDRFEEVNDPSSKQIFYPVPDQMEFEFYGGNVKERVSEEVNLVVMEEECESRRLKLSQYLNENGFDGVEIVHKDCLFSELR